MPLTSAERSRRYREKLKNENPEKLEAQRLKNLQRIKNKKKKISEMTEKEAEDRRKSWRKEKQASRQKKKCSQGIKQKDHIVAHSNNFNNDSQNLQDIALPLTSQTHFEKTVKSLSKKNTYLVNKCRRFIAYNKKIVKQKERYKKRYQRLQRRKEQEINELKTELMKVKAREEILEHTLKKTYQNCSKLSEKQTLKNLIKNSENKWIVTKMLGLKGKLREKKKNTRLSEITEITTFYMRDDVSRNTAGKKETRTKKKSKQQIRYLCDTLVNTFKKYKSEGGRYGFTTFYKSKPFFILSPGLNSRSTCLCPKHANIDFLHAALLKHKIICGTRQENLESICCDTNNYDCMYNTCQKCKDKKVKFNLATEEQLKQEVKWLQWERKEHVYEKKDETKKEVKTMKTEKAIMKGNVNDLKKKYENDLRLFKKHHFNNVHQQKEYQKAILEMQDNECMIVCDFSESYEAKLANEVQSMHFGASKRQISLHTGMVYWKGEAQSFCTMSDESSHQPPAIWAHLSPVIKMIVERTPNVKILHFYTDGPSSQYRQKNNFYLLAHFTKIYGFRYSTWSFYEAHHGKSVADGIGGSVKRNLDKKVCLGIDVTNARVAYEVSKECLKKTKVFLILGSDIDNISKMLPDKLPVLKGTMQLHQIITDEDDKTKIAYRDVSCFCGELRGQCDCFSPKFHSVIAPRPISDGMSPLDSWRSTLSMHGDTSSVITPSTAEETGFVPLVCVTGLGINVIEQSVKKITPWDLPQMVLELEKGNEFDKDRYHSVGITDPFQTSAKKHPSSKNDCSSATNNDLSTGGCNPENKTLKMCRPSKSRSCKPEMKIVKVKTPVKSQQLIKIPKDYLTKIEKHPNIETSGKAEPGEIWSDCSLPVDLKDCIVQPIIYEPAVQIQLSERQYIDEISTIALHEDEKYLPTNNNKSINNLCDQDANKNPINMAAKRKPLSEIPVIKSCKSEVQQPTASCSDKIRILEVKTYFPKRKKLLPGNAPNPVAKIVPSTERYKSKIQTIICLECQKCFTSISGPKRKCMICIKWYCYECVGQQIYPDYICDSCLES